MTLNGPLTVLGGGIISSGGNLTFGTGAVNSSFGQQGTFMHLTDTSLVLNTNLAIPYLHLSGNTILQTNGNKITPAYLEIGISSELDFTDITTNTDTILTLAGNSSVRKTGDLILKQIGTEGYTLTLNNAISSLTADGIYLSAGDQSHPNYGANTGEFLANGVNTTFNKSLWINSGKLKMGAGTLSLIQGGGMALSYTHLTLPTILHV